MVYLGKRTGSRHNSLVRSEIEKNTLLYSEGSVLVGRTIFKRGENVATMRSSCSYERERDYREEELRTRLLGHIGHKATSDQTGGKCPVRKSNQRDNGDVCLSEGLLEVN